jgi:predicted transcriptional regulator
MKKNSAVLSEREKDIMLVLWKDHEPLTASAIAEKGDNLSINTVQALIRKLLKNNYVEVADIVYSGTVLSRRYKPVLSAEEYTAENLQSMRKNSLNFSTLNFIDRLLKEDDATLLDELEQLIKSKKNKGGK